MMGNQVIGDFELVAKIGEGGMGEVFKGRDPMLHTLRGVGYVLRPAS